MYVGRIVSVALTQDGRICGIYRVSSRSFPNRRAVLAETSVSIVPKPGHEADVHKNPYIAYNCIRLACDRQVAVVTNGSQTDPIAEKIDMGVPARDALAATLLALDYEKDAYNTPRICAVVDRRSPCAGWLGVVREDGLDVRRMPLEPGKFFYVATYEEHRPELAYTGDFHVAQAEQACGFILGEGVFKEREHPVSAAAALAIEDGFELAARDMTE